MSDFGGERIEQYQYLRRESAKHARYFTVSALGLGVCLIAAGSNGPGNGWPWLLGAVACAFLSLWSVIEVRYFDLKSELHTLLDNLRRIGR